MDKVDVMDPVAFQQYLADEWAVERTDIYEEGILPLDLLKACEPVRPGWVLKELGVSNNELVGLMQSGRLGRPGKQGRGKVAWRFDEIAAVREWLKDVRD